MSSVQDGIAHHTFIQDLFLDAIASLQFSMSVRWSVGPSNYQLAKHSSCQSIQAVKAFKLS